MGGTETIALLVLFIQYHRLYAIYYWNSAKDTVYKLNSSRYGSSQHFAEADFGSVRHTDDSLADAAYFGRSHNINRWG